jgi:hypothetical protein
MHPSALAVGYTSQMSVKTVAVDWEAKLLSLRDRAVIRTNREIIGEDMHQNVWGTHCTVHCRLCGDKLFDATYRQLWRMYQDAGQAILGHEFVCEAEQLSLLHDAGIRS